MQELSEADAKRAGLINFYSGEKSRQKVPETMGLIDNSNIVNTIQREENKTDSNQKNPKSPCSQIVENELGSSVLEEPIATGNDTLQSDGNHKVNSLQENENISNENVEKLLYNHTSIEDSAFKCGDHEILPPTALQIESSEDQPIKQGNLMNAEHVSNKNEEISTGRVLRKTSATKNKFSPSKKYSTSTELEEIHPRCDVMKTIFKDIDALAMETFEMEEDPAISNTHVSGSKRTLSECAEQPPDCTTDKNSTGRTSFEMSRSHSEPNKALIPKSRTEKQEIKKENKQGEFQNKCSSFEYHRMNLFSVAKNPPEKHTHSITETSLTPNKLRVYSLDNQNQKKQSMEVIPLTDFVLESSQEYSEVSKASIDDNTSITPSSQKINKITAARCSIPESESTVRTTHKDCLIPKELETKYMSLTKTHFKNVEVPLMQDPINVAISCEQNLRENGQRSIEGILLEHNATVRYLEEPDSMLTLHETEIRNEPYMIENGFSDGNSTCQQKADQTHLQETVEEDTSTKSEPCQADIGVLDDIISNGRTKLYTPEVEMTDVRNGKLEASEITEASPQSHDRDNADMEYESSERKTKQENIANAERMRNQKQNSSDGILLNKSSDKVSSGTSVEGSTEIISTDRKLEANKQSPASIDEELIVVPRNAPNFKKTSLSHVTEYMDKNIPNDHTYAKGRCDVNQEYIETAIDVSEQKLENENYSNSEKINLCQVDDIVSVNSKRWIAASCTEIDNRSLKTDCSDDSKLLHKLLFRNESCKMNVESTSKLQSSARESLASSTDDSVHQKINFNFESGQKSDVCAIKLTDGGNESSPFISKNEVSDSTALAEEGEPEICVNSTDLLLYNYTFETMLKNEDTLNKSFDGLRLEDDSKLYDPIIDYFPDESMESTINNEYGKNEEYEICSEHIYSSEKIDSVKQVTKATNQTLNEDLVSTIDSQETIDSFELPLLNDDHAAVKHEDCKLNSNERGINHDDKFLSQIPCSENAIGQSTAASMEMCVNSETSESIVQQNFQKDRSVGLKNQLTLAKNIPLQHTCECLSYFLGKSETTERRISRKREIQALCLEVQSERYKRQKRIDEKELDEVLKRKENKSRMFHSNDDDEIPRQQVSENEKPQSRKIHPQEELVTNVDDVKIIMKKVILKSIGNLKSNYQPAGNSEVVEQCDGDAQLEERISTNDDYMNMDFDDERTIHAAEHHGTPSSAFIWNQAGRIQATSKNRPLRLGLSKKSKTKPLHPNLCKNRNIRL